jgi:hypothetical protein
LNLAEDHKVAAYVKNGDLFLSLVDFNQAAVEPVCVCEGVEDYVFAPGKLIYAPIGGGLYALDLTNYQKETLTDGELYHYHCLVASENRLYASRYTRLENFATPEDTVAIRLDTRDEAVIIPANVDNVSDEFQPPIGVSADDRYLYVLSRPLAGSVSADGVFMGVYDNTTQTYTPIRLSTLPHRENFSIGSVNRLTYIYGGNRAWAGDKTLCLWDPISQAKTTVSGDSGGAMHPCFSGDGRTLLYAEGKSAAGVETADYFTQHSIWEYNVETGQNRLIADKGFNIWPRYLDHDRSVCYVRVNGDAYDVYLKEAGEERLIIAGIPNYNYAEYYGYYDLTPILCISTKDS